MMLKSGNGKFRKSLRMLSALCALTLLLTALPGGGVMAAKKEEDPDVIARMIAGPKYRFEHMSLIDQPVNITRSIQRDGKWGQVTDRKAGQRYYLLDIDDRVLYDVPEYTCIDVDIEYYDDKRGSFTIMYPSHRPIEGNGVSLDMELGEAEQVPMQGTGQWKTHTFHLEDAKLDNGLSGCDIRVGVWASLMGESSGDVIFGDITVRRSELITPVKYSMNTDEPLGAIFEKGQKAAIHPILENKTDDPLEVKIGMTVIDENGTLIDMQENAATVMLDTKEPVTPVLYPRNVPDKFGVYSVHLDYEVTNKNDRSKTWHDEFDTEFSISYIIPEEEGDPFFGVCQQTIVHRLGDIQPVWKQITRVGGTIIREEMPWDFVEQSKGKLAIRPQDKVYYDQMREMGTKLYLIAMGENPIYQKGPPDNDESIAAYAEYCAFLAQELGDIAPYIEIWNEHNNRAFNSTSVPPETYAKMLKAAYTAIKAVNPDIIVVAGATVDVDIKWVMRVMDCGAYDYMDAWSAHPYDFSGVFRESWYLESCTGLKKVLAQYGPPKPIIYSEHGFSTFGGLDGGSIVGYTQKEQCANILMACAMCKAYDLCDKYIFYCFLDRGEPIGRGSNHGLVNKWAENYDGKAAYGAKKSFLSTAAMNELWGKYGEAKGVIADGRYYAFHFYNTRMQKDILLLLGGNRNRNGPKKESYDLGTKSVGVYDMYGNFVNTLTSDSGVYTVEVSETPFYLIGRFGKFESTETESEVLADSTEKVCAANDQVSFFFTAPADKKLSIEVENVGNLNVVRNDGFVDGEAELAVCPLGEMDKAELAGDPNGVKEKIQEFDVTVKDDTGRVYYSQTHLIHLIDPVKYTLTMEQISPSDSTRQRIRVTITNECSIIPISGTFRITGPEELAAADKERTITNLPPGKSRTFLVNLPQMLDKKQLAITAVLDLDTGWHADIDRVVR